MEMFPIIFAALIPAVFFIYIFYRSMKYKNHTKAELENRVRKTDDEVDAGVRKR